MKRSEQQKRQEVLDYAAEHPDMPVSMIAVNMCVKKSEVRKYLEEAGTGREESDGPKKEAPEEVPSEQQKATAVKAPLSAGPEMICSAEDIREKLDIPPAKLELLVLLGIEDGILDEDYQETKDGQFFSPKGLLYVFAKSQCTKYDALTELLSVSGSREKDEKIAMLEEQNAFLITEKARLEQEIESAGKALSEEKERAAAMARTLNAVRTLISLSPDGNYPVSQDVEGPVAQVGSSSPLPPQMPSEKEGPVEAEEDKRWVTIADFCRTRPGITPPMVRANIRKGRVEFKKAESGLYLIPASAKVMRFRSDRNQKAKQRKKPYHDPVAKDLREKGWLSLVETSARTGLGKTTVRSRCQKGTFNAVNTRDGWLIDPASLDAAGKKEMPGRKRKSPSSARMLPQLTQEEEAFCKEARELMKKKSEKLGIPGNAILHVVYSVMRNSYGYVSDQMKKDYRLKWNIDEGESLSTFRVIAAGGDARCREIFMSVLSDVEGHIREHRASRAV